MYFYHMKQKQISVKEDKDNLGLVDYLKQEAKSLKRSFSNHVLYILSEHREKGVKNE